jgi:CofD-related protein of GAK system
MTSNHTAELPNPVLLENFHKNPELGPAVLFFSGGSALSDISRALKRYSHNSIHLVTPFDSGGSSASLRQAFSMPSVGDLRSRLMSLADESSDEHLHVYRLLTYRLPQDGQKDELRSELSSMVDGSNIMMQPIPAPIRHMISTKLGYFQQAMPDDFDLSGACIGNLILAGGYLHHDRQLDQISFLFTKLVDAKGIVRTTISDNLHLMADLEDGTQVFGQHRLTGKEVSKINSPIRDIGLSRETDRMVPVHPEISKSNRKLIDSADLICFPPGSYYSSLIANLLPTGVGRAISNNPAPKVFVPSLGHDPEQIGMTTNRSIETLLKYLKYDAGNNCPNNKLLNYVLVDSQQGEYSPGASEEFLYQLGIQLIDTTLISDNSSPYYDPELLVEVLLSLT